MTLPELKKRAATWQKSNDALANEIAVDEGDMTEGQNARYDELFEKAASIRAELSAHGFGFLFRETAETIIAG